MPRRRNNPTRRDFVKLSALAGASAWAGSSGSTRPLFAQGGSPSEKLNVAFIGSAGKGTENISGIGGNRNPVNVVALCDVDENRMLEAARKHPGAKRYADYRKLLEERKDVDAVVVTIPDHSHAHAAVMAMNLGKHVYCEKPLTRSIAEARLMTETARRNKVATQMGNAGHAGRGVRSVVEALRAGVIGKVTEAHAWTNRPIWPQGIERPAEAQTPPPNLNWDLWLGPAPERPFHAITYHPFNWRGWWDFGTGALGDMGCHIVDPIYWGLDLGSPTSIEAEFDPAGTKETAPRWSIVRYQFPAKGDRPAVRLTWYDGNKLPPADLSDGLVRHGPDGRPTMDNGILVVGDKGRLMSDRRNAYKLLPEATFKDFQRPPQSLPTSPGHYDEWLLACKGGPAALSNFDYAGPFTEMILAGNLAIRLGKRIEWDGPTMRATNAGEADTLIRPEYRKGWELPRA